jgi:anti-anti-sigma regulatory factor
MPDYEEGPGVLKIKKDLGWVLDDELREKCRKLLDSKLANVVVDLASAEHVCSANLVVFAYVGAMAAKKQKRLKLILSQRTARAFQLAGFSEFADMEII